MAHQRTFQPFRELPWLLFAFFKTAILGGFATFFLIAFLTFDEPLFQPRFFIYQKWFVGFWLVGLVTLIVGFLLFRQHRHSPEALAFPFREEFLGLGIFVAGQTFILLGEQVGFHLEILHFFLFLLALGVLLRSAQVYAFYRERPAWYHPTTAGSFVQGAIAIGISLSMMAFSEPSLQHALCWILLIVLVMEILTIWSRLRHLNRTSVLTRQAVVMMLGTHLMLFAVRFIFGIIMPLVYLVWYLFIHPLPLIALPVMILVGELSERILFFLTAQPISSHISRN